MTQIYAWKCDICKKEFKEEDAGFKNRYELKLEIPLGNYESKFLEVYEDTCFECRATLRNCIEDTLDKLVN